MARMYDITVALSPGLPVWPGDPQPRVERTQNIADGDEANVTHIAACVHTGTHMDAPCHFVDGAGTIDAVPLDLLIGPATVIDAGDARTITPEVLNRAGIPPATGRLLIKSTNSALWDDPEHAFVRDFVALTPDAARWVVERGIRLIGVDYLSVQLFRDAEPTTHRVLLGAGVAVVEGLDLRGVPPGLYDLVCMPMKIAGSDGAPVRAVLTERPPA